MLKSQRKMNDQDRKWAFVEAMSRKDLETLAAAVIEQMYMAEGQFDTHVDWNDGDVCDALSTVLGNLGVAYSTLLAAKPRRRQKQEGKAARDMRKALLGLISTIENTGGIKADPEGPGTDVLAVDQDWVDLAEAYKLACKALGRTPKRAGNDKKEEEEL